jgi:GAF domain-containing protein
MPEPAAEPSREALLARLAECERELEMARERETATANVLKVISRSVSDARPVFEAILDSCQRLFGLGAVAIYLVEGDVARGVAQRGWLGGDWGKDTTPLAGSSTGQAIAERRAVHFLDLADKPDLPEKHVRAIREAGGLTVLYAPMLAEERGVGSIVLSRKPPAKPFTDREIAFIQTFADQAAIAIQNTRLFDETREALERQKASADVLGAIGRSVADTAPVFAEILDAGQRLLGAEEMGIYTVGADEMVRVAEWRGVRREEVMKDVTPLAESVTGRIIRERRPHHIPDLVAEPNLTPTVRERAERLGSASLLYAPMLWEERGLGSILVVRAPARPFSEREIELLQTFADQAAIAIENARLFNETREALAQQTATADVLKVISRSAFDLQAVLETLVESAVELADAFAGIIALREDGGFVYKAFKGPDAIAPHFLGQAVTLNRSSVGARALLSGEIEIVRDTRADAEFVAPPGMGPHSVFAVPLLRAGRVEGVFSLAGAAPNAFTQRHVDLVQTFADQAVIAIENVRLFDEVKSKTDDLTEALRMQTATSDVLKVISRSAFDLQAVFNTLVTSAVDLSGAMTGTICVRDGDTYRYRDTVGAEHTTALAKYLREHPAVPGRSTIAGRVLLSGKVERIPDCLADPEYIVPMGALASNVRSLLGVPLLRKEGVEGAIILTRAEPGEFTDRQVEIVQTFADQAVIALENVRLFDEVQARTRDLTEALQQQTATADVLKVISRSAFGLKTVMQALVDSAVRLCASDGVIYLRHGDEFRAEAAFGAKFPGQDPKNRSSRRPGRDSVTGRVALSRSVEQIPDNLADSEFKVVDAQRMKMRALLGVPLLRDGEVEGVFVLGRPEPGPFSDRAVELVRTFADQAVIALENVRLFEQVQSRTRELEQSLSDLRKTQDRLVQSEKLASLGQLTAGIAHEIKNPLNFVNNFAALSRELLDEMRETLVALPAPARAEAYELIGMIDSNLDKVVHHGKRADSIVKNMLLHSREGSGERTRVTVNAMVEEALGLGYHGARAEKPGFNVTIEKSLDPEAGEADLYLQEITRVLLNLIANGFYASAKRRESEGPDYQPTLTASTHSLGARVEIRIRDNGVGIPEAVREKMFDPFFTTKPAGEGTGLGLSLSHDIVVKQHGGSIEVHTEPGRFTEFIVTLPREGAKN